MLPVVSAAAQKLSEKSVAYTYDEKTSIEYSLTYTGFKEDIVVSEYTGQTEYDFTLRTGGLKLVEKNGSYVLTDEDGNIKATLGDIIVFTADERNNTMGRLSARTVTECEEYTITIILDADYLADEKTVYPIRIDPTVEITYENNGAGAIHDVTLNSLTDSSPTSASIFVGKRQEYGIARVLMKFPGLNLSSLGDNITITNATVEIRDVLCEGTEMNVSCYVFAGNEWDENTVEWANVSPNSYSTFLSSNVISFNNGYALPTHFRYSFDITSAVQGWKTGNCNPNKGIMFKADSSVENASTYEHRTFAAYNRGEHRPSLSVTYEVNQAGPVSNGTYYLNNRYTGNYLRGTSSGVLSPQSGLLSSLGNSIKWNITSVSGGYVIRSVTNSKNYLAVTESSGTLSLSAPQSPLAGGSIAEPNGPVLPDLGEPKPDLITVNGTAIPEKCIWTISYAEGGGCLLKNKSSGYYLTCSNGYLGLSASLGSSSTTSYSQKVWRVASTSWYGNTSASNTMEVSSYSSFSSVITEITIGAGIKFNKWNNKETWCEISDFTFSGYSPVIQIDNNGIISANKTCVTTVTATHKVTQRVFKFSVRINMLKIYETETTYESYGNGQIPEDFTYADRSEQDLLALGIDSAMISKTAAEHISAFRSLDRFASDEALKTVFNDMIDHFLDGTGAPYSNAVLTQKIAENHKTTDYINGVKQRLSAILSENGGNITSLRYENYLDNGIRDEHPLIKTMKSKNGEITLPEPSYGTPSNPEGGLAICVHSLFGNSISVSSYEVNGSTYTCTLHYNLYDHFGLDIADATNRPYCFFSEFKSWYILQHYSIYNGQYQPFVTFMEFDVTFTGTI